MRFLMIDRICEIEKDQNALGIKNLAMSEDYFADHFPVFPVMPGVLLLEAMVELSRWLVLYSSDFQTFCLLQTVHSLKLREPAHPGDSLRVRVECPSPQCSPGRRLFEGKMFLQEKPIAEARFENQLIPVTDTDWARQLAKNYAVLTARLKEFKGERR